MCPYRFFLTLLSICHVFLLLFSSQSAPSSCTSTISFFSCSSRQLMYMISYLHITSHLFRPLLHFYTPLISSLSNAPHMTSCRYFNPFCIFTYLFRPALLLCFHHHTKNTQHTQNYIVLRHSPTTIHFNYITNTSPPYNQPFLTPPINIPYTPSSWLSSHCTAF